MNTHVSRHDRRPAPRRRAALLLGALALLGGGCAGGVTTIYEGTYVRTWVELDGTVAQATGPVRLVLDEGGEYEIEGERPNHPPHGKGHYEMTSDGTLVLDDRSAATAGFDLSLLLSGTFHAAREGDGLVLRQENLWGHTHHLLLQRVSTPPAE